MQNNFYDEDISWLYVWLRSGFVYIAMQSTDLTLFAINSVSVLRFRRKIYSEECEHKLQVVDYYWFAPM